MKNTTRKHRIIAGLLFLFSISMFYGCGQKNTKSAEGSAEAVAEADNAKDAEALTENPSESTQETADAESDATVQASPTDFVSEEEMALADYWKGSDEAAIAAVMKKAEKGEKITIAVLGGSITQGTISNGKSDSLVTEKKSYADIFFSWWQETFPSTEVECINAGIGATDSYLGVHRVQADVLAYKPDLVLVEFSVNDSNTPFFKKAYDNLVHNIAESEGSPAVMLLFMSQAEITSAQEIHSQIGFSYSLPMVSYRNVIKEMEETGKYSQEELSGDVVHPSSLGHAITGEILWKYLNSVYEARADYGEPIPMKEDTTTKRCYTNARILDSETIEPDSMEGFEKKEVFHAFPNSFSTENGGEIKFTVNCANVGILYYSQIDGNGGQYEVYVDGNLSATLNADFKGGWGNCASAKECFTSDTPAEHEIVIKKKSDSTGDAFSILGLLVSDGVG